MTVEDAQFKITYV